MGEVTVAELVKKHDSLKEDINALQTAIKSLRNEMMFNYDTASRDTRMPVQLLLKELDTKVSEIESLLSSTVLWK